MTFKIKIAGYVFKVASLHKPIYLLCRDYLTEESFDFEFEILRSDIEFERKKMESQSQEEANRYKDEQLEITAVYRKICDILALHGVILFHSSAVAVDGRAYLFAAPSGTGKSTHAKLWKELLGDRVTVINDDKPLIGISDGKAIVYGTPWSGKGDLNSNISCPIGSICFIERGKNNEISDMEKDLVFPKLLDQTYRPNSIEAYSKVLSTLNELVMIADFKLLKSNATIEAAKLSYEFMNKE